ncbi:MAG: FlxA-like family protein [Lachnospiraceae bacterium]|nr:FlxA-like family protein [Lachnospiraceae bacterium]
MKINGAGGINLTAGIVGMNPASDSESRDLQRQIADEQKKLQELSADGSMSMEEKMKKRQEIQKKINELNIQLRQHQMELRRQAAQRTEKEEVNAEGGKEQDGKG